MIQDSYQAPWAFRSGSKMNSKAFKALLTKSGLTTADAAQNQIDPQLGYRPFAGCLAF